MFLVDQFLVAISPDTDPEWSNVPSLCKPQSQVGIGKATHVFNCAGTPSGTYLVSSVRGLGPMSVCTAQVYGGTSGKLLYRVCMLDTKVIRIIQL